MEQYVSLRAIAHFFESNKTLGGKNQEFIRTEQEVQIWHAEKAGKTKPTDSLKMGQIWLGGGVGEDPPKILPICPCGKGSLACFKMLLTPVF